MYFYFIYFDFYVPKKLKKKKIEPIFLCGNSTDFSMLQSILSFSLKRNDSFIQSQYYNQKSNGIISLQLK